MESISLLHASMITAIGGCIASLFWLWAVSGMAGESEAEWMRVRDQLIETLRDTRADLDIARLAEAEARRGRIEAEGKVDQLREALFRVHDVSRAWADNAEDA